MLLRPVNKDVHSALGTLLLDLTKARAGPQSSESR